MSDAKPKTRHRNTAKSSKNNPPHINLNLNVRGLSLSATLAINERSAELIEAGRAVFKFGLGQSPFPVPESVVEELKKHAHQKDYLPVKGLPTLRDIVADYHHRMEKIECSGENVLIGPGSKELMFILQLVYYGDLVIPTPSWVSYAPQATIIGRQIQWLPTLSGDGWRIKPEEIENLCRQDPDRPRIIILNYPNNPTGYTYSTEELKAIGQVARKYRLILLSDEIYGELHHRGQHLSIARYYPEGTIISSGLSKWCGAGGWRLGTFTFPKSLQWLQDAMAVVASETYTATSAPIQYAAIRAFQGGADIETYLLQSRRILSFIGNYIASKLTEAGAKVQRPQGAFYLFPGFTSFREKMTRRGINGSEAFCQKLLQDTGVAILPGRSFGRPDDELTARLAYVNFDGRKALEASDKIPVPHENPDPFLKENCPDVLNATERICQWLHD